MFDLYRVRQKRQQGQKITWYERPIPWFAACGFPFGLILASDTLIGHLSYPLHGYIILGFIALLLLFLAIGLIAVLYLEAEQNARDEEMRLRQLAASSSTPIAKSQVITNPMIWQILIIATLLSTFTLLHLILFYTPRPPEQFSLGGWIFLLLLTPVLLVLFGMIIRLHVLNRLLKRINRRRVALASENKRLVVSSPVSLEPVQVLMPPLVLRLKRGAINSYLAFVAAFILFWLLLLFPINVANIIIYTLFYPCSMLFSLLRGSHERVETTTRGLVVVRGVWFARWKQQISWQETRLFACYKMPGFFGGKTTMVYELSSPSRVVQWTRLIDTHSRFTFWKTEVSTDEYNRQMQELCACITTQTGLQLHNLSEERPNVRKQEMMMVQAHK